MTDPLTPDRLAEMAAAHATATDDRADEDDWGRARDVVIDAVPGLIAEIRRLTAELRNTQDSLASAQEALVTMAADHNTEMSNLRAEADRQERAFEHMWPVVDAACVWRAAAGKDDTWQTSELEAAVEAYRKAEP